MSGNSYLKSVRKSIGLTQREFAKKIKCSQSHWIKVEDGFSNPSIKLLKQIKKEFPDFDLNKLV